MEVQSKSKLKFLFVSSDKFPPFRVDVSILFGKKIVERGHTIDWLLQSDETLHNAYQTEWSGCNVLVGPTDNGTAMLSRSKKNLYGIFHDFKMFRILRKNRYNFILIKDKFVSALMAIVASKIFDVKFIYWLSYPFPEDFLYQLKEGIARYPLIYLVRGHLLKFLLYRIIMPFSDHIFVQTDRMQKDIAKQGIPKGKMTSVPMGISIKETPFFGYEPKQNEPNKEKIVLYLGTLSKVRKMDFLLRAFGKVLSKEENAKLYLIGGGDDPLDEQALKDESKRLGIDNAVLITGFLPQQEAGQYVKYANVCVSPISFPFCLEMPFY